MIIYICDDNRTACESIEELIKKQPEYNSSCEISKLSSANELHESFNKNMADVLFMDIELEDANGINIVSDLKAIKPELIVVYVTNHSNYVFDVFDTEPINFLTKPIDTERFSSTFKRVVSKYNSLHSTISIKQQNNTIELEIKDICFIEGYNRHLKYHLVDKEVIEVVGKIDKAFKELQSHSFIRTHQGFVVNMMYIKRFGNDQITMKNGEIALMSTRKKLEAKKTYYSYVNGGK